MALSHAAPGDVIPLLPAGSPERPARATALFKSRDLELIRLVLQAGESLPPHRVDGEITLQCLRGRLALGLAGGRCTLQAGEMSYVAGGATHDVVALDDCVALVTIALVRG